MKNFKIEALIIALGLLLLGDCIGSGIERMAERGRVVSVRGLAEKEVKADHVIWPIVYRFAGNDMSAIYRQLEHNNGVIQDFLVKNGINKADISVAAPEIVDKTTDRYNELRGDRYTIKAVMTVAGKQVDEVRNLVPKMGELLKEGIAISTGEYDNQVQYEFTSLNDIKPEMIEEATRNAREAAQKFATDSESELGKIQSATQGLFSITDRDHYTPYLKKVRVVTSVNYFLES